MAGKSRHMVLIGGIILALGLVPLLLPPYYVGLTTRALILAILAMSVNLLLGYLGLASVGQAAFFGVSAYTVAIFTRLSADAAWSAVGMGLVAAVLAAAIFGLLALRTKDIFFLVIMLAFCQVLYGIAFSWRSVTGGDDGLPGLARAGLIPLLSLNGTIPYYFFTVCIFLLVVVGFWLLVNSPFGLTLKGIRDSESRMKVLGYNVWLYKYVAFMIAGLIGGISGGLHAYYDGCPNPADFGVISSSTALIMVVLGGPGTLFGPAVGSIIIVFLREMVSGVTERWLLVLGCLYVAVVLFCPEGLLSIFNTSLKGRYGSGGRPGHFETPISKASSGVNFTAKDLDSREKV